MSAIDSAVHLLLTCCADFLAEVSVFGLAPSLVVAELSFLSEICLVLVQSVSCGPQCWLAAFLLPPRASSSDHKLLKIVIWEVLSSFTY